MGIAIKRVYEPAAAADGKRVLVDRLWPQGESKERAQLDEWMKDIAPSAELRKWFGHDPEKFTSFKQKYRVELDTATEKQPLVKQLLEMAKDGTLTLVYAAKDAENNDAVVLREYLEEKLK